MKKQKKQLAEIVANHLGITADKIEKVCFCETKCCNGKIAVTAEVWTDKYICNFIGETDDGECYQHSGIANTYNGAVKNYIQGVETVMIRQTEREDTVSFASKKQIIECLVESYSRQVKPLIKAIAQSAAAEIVNNNSMLQSNIYDEITYNSKRSYIEGEELAENHFQVGGRMDWAKLLEYVELNVKLEQLKTEVGYYNAKKTIN